MKFCCICFEVQSDKNYTLFRCRTCLDIHVCDICHIQSYKPEFLSRQNECETSDQVLDNLVFDRFLEQCPVCRSRNYASLYSRYFIARLIKIINRNGTLSLMDTDYYGVKIKTYLTVLSNKELQLTIVFPSLICDKECDCRHSAIFRCGVKEFIYSSVEPLVKNWD